MLNGLSSDHRDRISLLYALSLVGRCSEDQLLRYILDADIMDQFGFYLALGDLKEASLVKAVESIEGNVLVILPEGRKSLEMFAGDIWDSVQTKLDRKREQWKQTIREELQMPASWKEENGHYRVRLRALEADEEILAIEMIVPDKAQALDFCSRWPAGASEIYGVINHILGLQK